VIDVDRYEDRAVVLWVLSAGEVAAVFRDVFKRRGLRWIYVGGGGTGGGNHVLTLRDLRPVGDPKLQLLGSGGGKGSLSATILCSPEVARVEVRRKQGTRSANVEDGPGLLSVLWSDEDKAEMVAFDRDESQICTLVPQHRVPDRGLGTAHNFSNAGTRDSGDDAQGSDGHTDDSEEDGSDEGPA
jgi:hypothetical protein